MMTEELKVKVSLDTSDLKNGIKRIKDTLSGASSGFGGMEKATANAAKSTQSVTAAVGVMGATTVAQTALMTKAMSQVITRTSKLNAPLKSIVKTLKDDFAGAFAGLGKDFDPAGDNKIKAWFGTLKTALKEIGSTSELVGRKIKQNLGEAFKKAGDSIKANLKTIRLSILGVMASITAFVWGIINLSESTREFRQAINQVSTAFITLGSDAETATATYQAFYRVLGDTRRAAEATNLLAQITTEEKNLVTWTKIATGAMAMLPDSLPTESLIEAANETIKTAKVTGVLADALNWPAGAANKISKALEGSAEAQQIFNDGLKEGLTVEDAFNKVLAETNSQTQREVILRSALNGVYSDSAELYEEMNKELIKQNEAQMRLNEAMSKLGKIVQPVQTAFTNLKATLAEALAPAIQVVSDLLVKLIDWLTIAASYVGAFFAVIFPGAADKIAAAFSGVSSAINNATNGTDEFNKGLEDGEDKANKIRKALMGFDELNVVSVQTDTGSSSSSSGSSTGTGNGIDISGLDVGDSVFQKAKVQLEDFKAQVSNFLTKWKEEIVLIAASLGLWKLTDILTDFGKLIGLSDGFLANMDKIKNLAVSAITIVLQYSLVNEFMDKYIDGAGFKEYLKGLLVSAIGTGVLYAMWGTPGLVIGLGVTAVASISAVIENGGITDLESAVVGLTGLATAIGAVGIAWKSLGLGKLVGDFGAFFQLLREGNGLTGTLAAAFPKISNALAPVITKVGTFVSGLTAGPILLIAGIIAAIVAVVIFLKENWEEVTAAVKRFFETNISPKLENIKESFRKMGEALGPIGEAIGNVVKAIADWFSNMNILEGIGKVFEVIGGIIFSVVSGVIAGAISMFVSIIEGAVQFITGIVEIVSGVIEAIVKLFSGDLTGAAQAVDKIITGIVDLFKGLWGLIVKPLEDFVYGVIDWFIALWDELVGHSIVPDTIEGIVKCFKDMPEKVFKWIKQFVEGVISRLKDLWDKVINLFKTAWEAVKATWNVAGDFFKAIWNAIKTAFAAVGDWFKDIFSKAWEGIKASWSAVGNWFSGIWNAIKAVFGAVKSWFSSIFGEAWQAIQNVFKNWGNFFSGLWDKIKNTFSNLGTKIADAIGGAIKSGINGVIGMIENTINGAIKLINGAINLINLIPGINIGSIGQINLPRLAKGGIVDQATIAMVGERGKEAVVPLENNTEWMDKLADRIAARNNTPTKIVLQIGEKELGWATIGAINGITKQTGGLQLVL